MAIIAAGVANGSPGTLRISQVPGVANDSPLT